MPDGENTGQDESGENGTPEEEPLPPDQQISAEINLAQTQGWLFELVGAPDAQYEAGGGGEKGQFMFADLAELDGVLRLWEQQAQDIESDRQEIEFALDQIRDPADDMMSRLQAGASRSSLEAMLQHNVEMAKYTEDYIMKLTQSRQEMANQDAAGSDQMRAVY